MSYPGESRRFHSSLDGLADLGGRLVGEFLDARNLLGAGSVVRLGVGVAQVSVPTYFCQ